MQTTKQAGVEAKTFARADETRDRREGKDRADPVRGRRDRKGDPPARMEVVAPRETSRGTNSCEAPHFQYHLSGRLRIRMDDGTEIEAGPGDVTRIPPGHDAWVVGNEPVVMIDWSGMEYYAVKLKR